ncbi:MAG: DUF411 domain-containing protein [Candidatus Paceibacterota bacterium]
MKNKNYILLFLVVLIGLVGFAFMQSSSNMNQDGILASVYKSPNCGCCSVYASYMSREGYNVETHDFINMREIKEKYDIPYELESCHTSEIEGYVVEGHVPNEAIEKLLAEKPNIKGIGMPGMPAGSPGMPGPKNGEFSIYEINNDGTEGDVFMNI